MMSVTLTLHLPCGQVGNPSYELVRTLSKAAAGSLVLANDLRHGGRAVIKLLERGPGVTKNLEREILTHRR